jgi:uncharacterized protein YabE (DUF348 family)
MNNLTHKTVMPFGTIVIAVLFLIIMGIIAISGVTHADNGKQPQNGRLITIHDRGTEKVIVSQADTIGDALKEAGVTVDNKDAVEPATNVKMVASDYQVNIYRARPVMIIDGNTRTKVVTPYQTAEQIAESAGIELYDGDTAKLDRADNILTDGAGLQLTINRATSFTFTLYGRTSTVRTQATTVGKMLVEKNITLSQNDRASVALNDPVAEGMAIKVWREGKQTVTVDEPVEFDVEKIKDADQEVGYREIRVPGQAGTRSVTYEIMIQDGQEVGRTEIASIVTKQAVKQVEVVGAKGEYTTPSENENITWDFLISNGFTRQQAAGIMGNLMQEHGFKTSDTTGGLGIAQWTGGRRAALLAWPYPENIYTQLNFLMYELNNNYVGVKNNIMLSTTVDNAVLVFQNQFERCGLCMQDRRIQYAYNILASH